MKKRAFIIATALSLLFALCGIFSVAHERPPAVLLTVTLCVSHCDNALARCMSTSKEEVRLGGAAAVLNGISLSPSKLCETENGERHYYPSQLFSDVILSLSLRGERRQDVFYAASSLLSVGASVALSTSFYCGNATVIAISAKNI